MKTTPKLRDKNNQSGPEDLDLKKAFSRYLKEWKWFLLCIIIFCTLAFFNLRYANPEYNAYAKIMLLQDDASSNPAETILQDLGQFSGGTTKAIEDEIEVLKSRQLMAGVIEKLNLNIRFYAKGRLHDTQFFPNDKAPIKVNFIASDSILNQSFFKFSIRITSETTFDYILGEDEENTVKKSFGENISTSIGDIIITPNMNGFDGFIGEIIYCTVDAVDFVAESYKEAITILPAGEKSKVIDLSLNDASIRRAKAVINTLIDEYNRTSIEEKNAKTTAAADFIDKRIDLIATDLSSVDSKIEQFKTGNKLTDITSEAKLYLDSNAQNEQELTNLRTQFNMVNFMKDQVNDNSLERIPSNIGVADPALNGMAIKYNELLSDRDRLLKSSNEKNPIVVNLDQEIRSIKQSLRQNLNNTSKSIGLRVRSLENQSAKISQKIYAVPGQVTKSRDIQREQGVKESLYLFLLQKREEATISAISTTANAKVIDRAHSLGFAVSPNIKMTYIAAVLVGLFLPFGFFYVKDLLDNKIHNKEDLEKIIKNITVLGEVPRISGDDAKLIQRNDRSVLSESFRIIRTNFDYIKKRKNTDKYNNIIFVTSTINGEGKSFFSLNMALTVANTKKKVLLIGADVRNPQILPLIKDKKSKELVSTKEGLSEYLADKSVNLKDTIEEYNVNNIKIDVLLSGKVPPNPAELLMDVRISELFDNVSEDYDYVIVDTAPSMLVTDTLLISEYAGHTIYVTRADHTEKKILNFAQELYAEDKLNGMMLVINDVNQSNFGYGAKYGYYGAPEKKGFLEEKSLSFYYKLVCIIHKKR